jgi:hypothetical protein
MPRYVEANSLKDIAGYLDGIFDTQLFRSLCVDIARFLPSRYVPDKRTMQANRDRFERKQLLQGYGEPDYDSPLLSASKTDQKRKSPLTTTRDASDKKRVKSTKKTSPASKSSKTIPSHSQCNILHFNDEDDNSSSPSGGEEVGEGEGDDEERNSEEETLPLHNFFLSR